MKTLISEYQAKIQCCMNAADWTPVERLAEALLSAVGSGNHVFLCGNGGSAGNAMHLANDFLYGINPNGQTMKVEALPANSSVLTCLGNDIGYENIFAHQLKMKASPEDVLIVLSGSGNSPNILKAIDMAREKKAKSFAVLGYSGGKAKALADVAIHFSVDDMQIAEDMQLIVGHMLMQYLKQELTA